MTIKEHGVGSEGMLNSLLAQLNAAREVGDSVGMAKCRAQLRAQSHYATTDKLRARYIAAVGDATPTKSMAKSLSRPSEINTAVAERRPSPSREFVEMQRDLSIAANLFRANQRFAKCIHNGDAVGAINALNCRASASLALAKSEPEKELYRKLRHGIFNLAHAAGLEKQGDGSYAMAKAVGNAATAKQFDAMYSTLTQLMERQTDVAIRNEVETLRNSIVSRALAYGCRLKNGKFVPYAS